MWWIDKNTGFHCKTMAYTQSCFPCSLHLVLRNLGQPIAEDDSLEQAWNQMQLNAGKQALDAEAPDELDVHRNFGATKMLGSGIIISPAFLNQGDATDKEILDKVCGYFASPRAGMVIGLSHAGIVFKMRDDLFVFVHVSKDEKGVDVQSDSEVVFEVVKDTEGRAVRVRGKNKGRLVVAGDFCAIIT